MSSYHRHINRQRRTGVLLHPTSLPGELDHGDFGHEAYRFIEFLSAWQFRVWQMLPLGPTHEDRSPYQCLSSHGGNPLLISLDWLNDRGWLDKNTISIKTRDKHYRQACLQQAAENFYRHASTDWLEQLEQFKQQQHYWLDDYALFCALKVRNQNAPWYHWPAAERHRDKELLEKIRHEYHVSIAQTVFEQFIFFQQWSEIRDYAHHHGIELFGDMPIFVARDSADVWAQKENFLIDANGEMEFVAGVPPDAFSDTGQRWGNPLFNWEHMQDSAFDWWKQRLKTQLKLFDLVRIDHFRGLQACWYIPASDDTAINGKWVEVPGREMLQALFNSFDKLPFIAEDLGVITAPVIKLKKDFHMPGMKVLQFAFSGQADNPHLLHYHEPDDVVYTGTHDNDTILGWLSREDNYNKNYLEDYINSEIDASAQGVLSMIRLALSSVSFLCVIPMQDLLLVDSTGRMNVPGTMNDNWRWRFDWQQLNTELMKIVNHYMHLYHR